MTVTVVVVVVVAEWGGGWVSVKTARVVETVERMLMMVANVHESSLYARSFPRPLCISYN